GLTLGLIPAAVLRRPRHGRGPDRDRLSGRRRARPRVGSSTVSVAVAVYETAIPAFEGACTVMPTGTWMTGAVVSWTLTSKAECETFECASCAVHVTVVWPSAKVVPDAGAQVTATAPSTASLAVGTA